MLSFGRQDYFQRILPQRLAKSSNVKLVTWSTVTELRTSSDAGAVSSLQVACLDGNRFQVKARMVILAQGAFEVPRLLLASRSAMATGLGNQHDLVGRYLMDRQIVKTGTLFAGLGRRAARFRLLRHAPDAGAARAGQVHACPTGCWSRRRSSAT